MVFRFQETKIKFWDVTPTHRLIEFPVTVITTKVSDTLSCFRIRDSRVRGDSKSANMKIEREQTSVFLSPARPPFRVLSRASSVLSEGLEQTTDARMNDIT